MAFSSLETIINECERKRISVYRLLLEDDMEERGVSEEESFVSMLRLWNAMKDTAASYDADLRSASGLSGGQGRKMEEYRKKAGEDTFCGPFINEVMQAALETAESNACMRRIVAAPTAGSCGVIPAVFIPTARRWKLDDRRMTEALYVAAGIGQVIAERASIAGASGGCQAEIGSASAMAAGALVYLRGGSVRQTANAAALALKSILGLVCDPVAGLVEVPCVKRNVMGAVNAMTSADLSLAGIESFIPPDQVIDAMKEVGDRMHVSLRETGAGGLAGTRKARDFASAFMKQSKKNL